MSPLNIYQILLLIAFGQGFFLSPMLFISKKGDTMANKLLSGAVFLMAFYTAVFFLNDTGYRYYVPILILNGYSITPLIPVVFYFYFKQLIDGNLEKNYYLHLIPFLLQFIYWLPNNTSGIFHTLSPQTLNTYYSITIVRSVSGVHIILFAIYAYVFFTRFNFDSLKKFPEKQNWLKKIRSFYIVLAVIFVAGLLSIWFTDTNIGRYVFFFTLSGIVYIIGYYGYVQSDVLFQVVQNLTPKYYHSQLTKQESKKIYEKLLSIMSDEKPYLNSSIKIRDIANQLNISSNHLSRAINENYGSNFVDFINKYRIEEAKNILNDEKRGAYKMLAVALDAGFGNKVSFYKNFKKFTGNLPTEFRNQSY